MAVDKLTDQEIPAFRKSWHATFVDSLRKTPNGTGRGNVSEAARVAGVSRTIAYRDRASDEVFAKAWDEAVAETKHVACESLQRVVFNWATIGVPVTETREKTDADGKVIEKTTVTRTERSPFLAKFLMQKWMPDTYGDVTRVEQTGADGGPIELSVTTEVADVAVRAFNARVVQLADARRARELAAGDGA